MLLLCRGLDLMYCLLLGSLPPAEDGQGDDEEPDDEEEEAAEEYDEGGLELFISLILGPLHINTFKTVPNTFLLTRASAATHCHWLHSSQPSYLTLISRLVPL